MNSFSVQELRQELRERGVSSTGSKKQLQRRLADLFDSGDTTSSASYDITSASGALAAGRQQRGAAVHVIISVYPANGKSSTLLVPLHWSLEQILDKGGNKLRLKATRLFIASSGLELLPHHLPGGDISDTSASSSTHILFDGIKLVLTKGKEYEAPKQVMSPLQGPILGESKRTSVITSGGAGNEVEHKQTIDVEVEKAMAAAMFGDDGIVDIAATKMVASRSSSGSSSSNVPAKVTPMIVEQSTNDHTDHVSIDDELPKRSSPLLSSMIGRPMDASDTTTILFQRQPSTDTLALVTAEQQSSSTPDVSSSSLAPALAPSQPSSVPSTDDHNTNEPAERKSKRAIRYERQKSRIAARAAGGTIDKDRAARYGHDRRRADREAEEAATNQRQRALAEAQAVAHARLRTPNHALQPLPIVRLTSSSSDYHTHHDDDNDNDNDNNVSPTHSSDSKSMASSPRGTTNDTQPPPVTTTTNGRNKPRWRDATHPNSGSSSRRTSAAIAIDDAHAGVMKLDSSSNATTTAAIMQSMSGHITTTATITSSHSGHDTSALTNIELDALRAKNSELIRGHDVLTRQSRSLLAQNKSWEKSEKKLKEEVARLTLQITKLKGAQEKFRDVQATLSQQEAAMMKLTRERDRLKDKNQTLAERCAAMNEMSKDLRDQQSRNATLQMRVDLLEGKDVGRRSMADLTLLLAHFGDGITRVHQAITAQLERDRRALMERRLCKICMDKEIGCLILPCSHFISCETCARKVTSCPVCRRTITERKPVYTS